jgi:hypothetical protein
MAHILTLSFVLVPYLRSLNTIVATESPPSVNWAWSKLSKKLDG